MYTYEYVYVCTGRYVCACTHTHTPPQENSQTFRKSPDGMKFSLNEKGSLPKIV